ncbi:hypothetical protein NHQ30_009371 [Ciborinia camelliae]|nr:hypothetical protein NHQ30_009371 [Ciborinia camelliae]
MASSNASQQNKDKCACGEGTLAISKPIADLMQCLYFDWFYVKLALQLAKEGHYGDCFKVTGISAEKVDTLLEIGEKLYKVYLEKVNKFHADFLERRQKIIDPTCLGIIDCIEHGMISQASIEKMIAIVNDIFRLEEERGLGSQSIRDFLEELNDTAKKLN